MVEGLAPPTRAVVHSHETICRRLRIQYASLHMCGVNQFWIIVFFTAVKPANNSLFCIELIQRSESSLRRHKLGLTDQSILSNDDKTRFTCVHRLMTTGHSQNICRKVRWLNFLSLKLPQEMIATLQNLSCSVHSTHRNKLISIFNYTAYTAGISYCCVDHQNTSVFCRNDVVGV